MARIGKRILSAFIDIEPRNNESVSGKSSGSLHDKSNDAVSGNTPGQQAAFPKKEQATRPDPRFTDYFDKLFSEANIPGPDYYEFSKMIEAMQAIPNEQARFFAAFAGLQVQGLDKEKLLSTAGEYLRMLSADADRFHTTVDAALQEKVHGKAAAVDEKSERIRALSLEITGLQEQIAALQAEITENKEKLETGNTGYAAESERRKARIEADMEKIRHYIH
jgi:hypothetical protein